MIKINGKVVNTFNFSGGEVHPKIERIYSEQISIHAFLHNANDIMELLLVKNAVDQIPHYRKKGVILNMPYIPYARQDRVCNPGEALSIKVFCDLINNMNFDKVIVADPHSDVAPALLNNCVVISQQEILQKFEGLKNKFSKKEITLVSPDAGAEKKILKVAQHFGGLEILHATKIRDTTNGQITSTELIAPFVIGDKDFLIVDDICDGGMTFIKLAEEIKKFQPKSISLYVTHGIFSKGYLPLLEAGISEIYTTDSFPQTYEIQELRVVELL